MHPRRPAQYTATTHLTTTLLAFLSALAAITIFPGSHTAAASAPLTPTGESTWSWIDRLRAAMANILPTLDLADDGANAWVLLQRIHGVFISQGWPSGLPASQVAKLRADLDNAALLLASAPADIDPLAAGEAAVWIAQMRARLDEVYP